jgi:hypothetical protein
VGNDGDLHRPLAGERVHGEADPGQGDGAVQHRQRGDLARDLHVDQGVVAAVTNVTHGPHAVHVPLHQVPAEPVADLHRPLQVHPTPRLEPAEGGAAEGGGHRLHREAVRVQLHHRLAGAVHRHAVAERQPLAHPGRPHGEAHAVPLGATVRDGADLLDQSGEHVRISSLGR